MTGKEALEELVKTQFIPFNEEGYALLVRRTGTVLEPEKPVEEWPVEEGELIHLIPCMRAGAMSPAEIRKVRLSSDYKQMCNIQGDIIHWEAIKGTPPYVEAYRITLKIRTIIDVRGGQPVYRGTSVVRVTLPAKYPYSKPDVVMESSPQPFHPNWWSHKAWCPGIWTPSEALGDHIIRMAKTLQYDLDITNERSPANSAANEWYIENKNSGLFPCDTQRLPDPSSPNGGAQQAASGFRIKTWRK